MSVPAVSVVMPVYNADRTVLGAARSVLDGTFENLELIIVDDGSTDATRKILSRIRDPRTRVVRQSHQGIVAALNLGVTTAQAPFIARMDADDESHPDRFTLQMQLLQCGETDMVGSRVSIVDPTGQPVTSMRRYEEWINQHCSADEIAALRFVESPFVHPTVTARREVFELGYRTGDFPEDYDLWLRAIKAGFRAVKLPRRLLRWTESPNRMTRRDCRYRPEAFDLCKREHLREGPLDRVATVDLWGAGQTGKPWLRWLQKNSVTVRRLYDIDPNKLGQSIHGVRVDHADDLLPANGIVLLIAVGAEGARELIKAAISSKGYRPGTDAWFLA